MPARKARREPKGIPWNERVVVDDFERDALVTLAFPAGPSADAFLPSVPRLGELLTSRRWGRTWRTEGRFRASEVEWQYEGRVPGRVVVHLEPDTLRRARHASSRGSGTLRWLTGLLPSEPRDEGHEVGGMDPYCSADSDVRKLAALDHRVDRRATDAEPGGDLADGQKPLGEGDAVSAAPYDRPIRRVFCFVGRRTGGRGS
jgi:hypothetical protein